MEHPSNWFCWHIGQVCFLLQALGGKRIVLFSQSLQSVDYTTLLAYSEFSWPALVKLPLVYTILNWFPRLFQSQKPETLWSSLKAVKKRGILAGVKNGRPSCEIRLAFTVAKAKQFVVVFVVFYITSCIRSVVRCVRVFACAIIKALFQSIITIGTKRQRVFLY